jgi:AraC-like DNA-binding protein
MGLPAAPRPLFRHSCRLLNEPDEFADAASGIHLEVDFQKKQERVSQVEQFQSAGWALDFGEANVRTRVRGVLEGGWGSLCLVRGPGHATWNGQASAPGMLSLLPPGGEVDGCTSADFAWLTAAIPPEVWQRCVSVAGAEESLPQGLIVCRLPDSLLARIESGLRQSQRSLLAEAGREPMAVDDTASFIADFFTAACELATSSTPPKDSIRNRTRLARRAEAWLQDHIGEAVQVPDLCLALHVSRRELEYAFRSTFDQSPRDYLETMRLNAIRRALLRADAQRESIIGIAYEHGVTHLGRFAANYRKLFGEKPGETLRR